MTQASFKSTPVLKYLLFKTLLDLHCLIFVKTRQIMDSLKHSLLVPLTYPGLISLALWLCVAFFKSLPGQTPAYQPVPLIPLVSQFNQFDRPFKKSLLKSGWGEAILWVHICETDLPHLENTDQLRWCSMQDLPVPTLKNHIVSDHLPQLRQLDVKRALAYYS